MIFVIITDDFYQKIFISDDEKMGCLLSKNDEPKIQVFDCTRPGDDFDYLKPQGKITLSIDRKYNIPIVDIRFDGWYEKNVCLWPKHREQRKHFLLLESAPLQTPSVTSLSSDDSGVDTVF